MQALAEKLVLERLLNSWVLTYISPLLMAVCMGYRHSSGQRIRDGSIR